MKILVTGCAGFIGSHTVEYLLSQGVEVIGIDNFDNFYSREIKLQNLSASHVSPLFTFVEGDICSSSDLSNLPSGISGVIHLAARAGVRPSILNPEAYIHTNISGTQNILSWMGKRKIRNLVFASSSSVYGDVTPLPFREDALVAEPVSPYAWTKRCGELMTFTAHHLNQLSVVNLRIFTAYGPRQRPDLAIRKFTELIERGEAIPVYGDGSTARDYTFVQDLVLGIWKALVFTQQAKPVYEIINLGSQNPVSLSELIRIIGKVLGREPVLNYLPMQPGDVIQTFADTGKAARLLNYSATCTLEKGIEEFYIWMKTPQVS